MPRSNGSGSGVDRVGPRTAFAIAALVLLVGLPAPEADAHALWKADETFPFPFYYAGVVWTGTHAYILGNADWGTTAERRMDEVWRFEPESGELVRMPGSLPYGRSYAAAAWDGSAVWLFGGRPGTEQDRIVRYDPATGPEVMPFRLPAGREGAAGAFDPRPDPRGDGTCLAGCAYVFGGWWRDGEREVDVFRDDVYRFDPQTLELSRVGSLPEPLFNLHAAFDGTGVWLFGGQTRAHGVTDLIRRFDPVTGATETLAKRLPAPNWGSTVVWNGTHVLVVGGRTGVTYYQDILAFDPVARDYTELDVKMPDGRWGVAVVPWGDGAVLLGGFNRVGESGPTLGPVRDILRFHPDLPAAPATPTVVAGPVRGSLDLSWTDVHDDGASAYRVERGDGTFVAEVAGTTFSETGLPEGTFATYRVRAVNSFGAGPPSPVAGAYPAGVPSAVRSLRAVAGPQPGEIGLSWSEPASDGGAPILGYQVWAGATPQEVDTLLGTTTGLAFSESGLPTGTHRFYRVVAENRLGTGAPASVDGWPPTVPSAPTRVRAETGLGQITVSWSPPATNGGTAILRYVVERAPPGGDFAPYATTADTRYVDEGRAHGVEYRYRVAAENGVGVGPRSAAASGSAVGPLAFKVKTSPFVLYDDRDDDNVVDPGEALVPLP